MNETVQIQHRGDVVEITLNDPEHGNLVTPEMSDRLEAALRGVTPDKKLILLRAAGTDFCRGRKPPQIDRAAATAMTFRNTIAEGPLRLYDAFREARAPILGLVQGQAQGVGCVLAALCDITIATEDAVFGVPEMAHGIPPLLVISALADRTSHKAIAHLVYSAAPICAQRALELNLVNEIVAPDQLAAAGERFMRTMLENEAITLRGVKEFLRYAPGLEPKARACLAANLISNVQSSQGP
jgi:enoyl-CoA hydratase